MPTPKNKRSYRKEYDEYQGKPEQKKNRAKRNRARNDAIKEGRVKKGTSKNRNTMEIDHKESLKHGGSNSKSNQRIVSRAVNRKKGAKNMPKKKGKK